MTLKEEKRDLLSVPQGYYLAICDSCDIEAEKGLPKVINDLFNVTAWQFAPPKVGSYDIAANVFLLHVKETPFQKATYRDLTNALVGVRDEIETLEVKKIAMPRLGCGGNGLDWETVKSIIIDIFKDMDVEILVCEQ